MLLHNVFSWAQDSKSVPHPRSPLVTHQQSLSLSVYSFKSCHAFCKIADKIKPSIAILLTNIHPSVSSLCCSNLPVLSSPLLLHPLVFLPQRAFIRAVIPPPLLPYPEFFIVPNINFFCFQGALYLNPHVSVIWY